MNIIANSNVIGELHIIYVGVKQDLISSSDALKLISIDVLNELDTDQISKLYEKEDEKEAFLQAILEIGNLSNFDLDIGKEVWELIFLRNINSLNLDEKEKLEEISRVWPKFEYPTSWRNFINYLPPADENDFGVDKLYNNYITYIEQQSEKLKKYFLIN